jgi:hypothetical protein
MRPIFTVVQFTALLMAGTLAHGAAANQMGIVKSLRGEVVIARGGSTIQAEPNLKLYEGDVIRTGPNGKAGIILEDDTVISLGFNSRLAIESFKFQPSEKKLSLVARLFQGTASFICGQIAKLAPKQVHIETPYATVGVRGTHVLLKVD